jgi:hypothetical protein
MVSSISVLDQETYIEDYLVRLIEFKNAKELHPGYLKKDDCKNLLKELTLSLGFEASLWKLRKRRAAYYYSIFTEIKRDYSLGSVHPKAYKALLLHFIVKTINLDPFNEEYLKTYLYENQSYWKPEKFRKIQYLQLFKPSSTETTSIQIELGIRPDDLNYDYFSDDVIGPFVNEMVFLKDIAAYEKQFTPESELKDMAKEAGIDKALLEEVNKELEEMFDVVHDTFDNHWLSWKEIHKAYLTVDKMVELSPYHPYNLEAAINFYGLTLWRALLTVDELKENSPGYKEFCLAFYGKKKPKMQERITAANDSLEKAKALVIRYNSLPKKLREKKSIDEMMQEPWNFNRIMKGMNGPKTTEQMNGFLKAQLLMSKIYSIHARFTFGNFKFALLSGLVLYIIAGLISLFVLGNLSFILTFIVLPAILAGGLVYLRNFWWKSKQLDLELEKE